MKARKDGRQPAAGGGEHEHPGQGQGQVQRPGDQVRQLLDGFRAGGNTEFKFVALPKADHTLRIVEGEAVPDPTDARAEAAAAEGTWLTTGSVRALPADLTRHRSRP